MKRYWRLVPVGTALSVLPLGAVTLGCSVAVSGRASMFQREVASEEQEDALLIRLLAGAGEDAARAYLKARGLSDEQITKRIEKAKEAK